MHPMRPARICRLSLARTLVGLSAGTSLCLVGNVQAAGFALIEHGASGLGVAYAGGSVANYDSSTAWFNPAGMSEIDSSEAAFAAHVIISDTRFENRGTTLGTALGDAQVRGPDSANGGTTTVVPNLYFVQPFSDTITFGLGIDVPFGSSTEYDRDWVGRYTTVKSSIQVIDINPSISYRFSDSIRFGGGISIQFLSAGFDSAVDSGAACLAVYSQVGSEDTCFDNGLTPGNVETDGYASISGDSTGVGFNLGALFLPREGMRVGIAFRSGVDHDVDGDADFDTNATLRALLDAAGQTTLVADQDIDSEVSLPPSLSLSASQRFGDKLNVMGDLTWTGWSSFDELRITYDNGQPETLSLQSYDDVFRVAIGGTYEATPDWQLRAGLAYDEEAIPGPEQRTARIPGNDRTWLSFGAGYRLNEAVSFDVGYAHLFLPTTAIDNQNLEANSGRGGSVVRGEYESSVDILSAQLNWSFN